MCKTLITSGRGTYSAFTVTSQMSSKISPNPKSASDMTTTLRKPVNSNHKKFWHWCSRGFSCARLPNRVPGEGVRDHHKSAKAQQLSSSQIIRSVQLQSDTGPIVNKKTIFTFYNSTKNWAPQGKLFTCKTSVTIFSKNMFRKIISSKIFFTIFRYIRSVLKSQN